VNAWNALTSDRPQRKAWTNDKAIAYIKEQAGKHFDPDIVDKFLIVIQR
jgi:HD-GYP domain-containing protein (c-di-GMP phosphodiesterase class II)